MRAASLAKSKRLQRVDRLLADGGWHSTREIIQEAQVCAVNSVVAELRENGRGIECRQRGRYWYYRRTDVKPQGELFTRPGESRFPPHSPVRRVASS